MPIYLSDYIGSGTRQEPFRPRGWQPGAGAIDLRPDGGATLDGSGLNRCLLYLPVADPDPALYQLADQFGDDVPVGVRSGLAARLNATLNYTRLDDLLADLLLRPPANAWKPLRAKPTRPLTIHLGRGQALSPSPNLRALAAKIFEETWSTADNASLTSDLTWTELYGGGVWALSGNRARMTGNVGGDTARADHDTDTDDQVVRATLAAWTYSSGGLYAAISARQPNSTAQTRYNLTAGRDATLNEYWIEKEVAGAFTTLHSDPQDPASGDSLELGTVDDEIWGVVNGTLLLGPVTDMAISGHTRAGITGYSDGASNMAEFDRWSVRDYRQGAPFTVGRSSVGGTDVLQGIPSSGPVEADGASAGSATVTGVSGATKGSDGSAAGTGAAPGTGAAIKTADGDSDGAATVSGQAAAVRASEGDADGVASVSGTGASIAAADGDSDGQATVTGVSGAIKGSAAAAAGVATPDVGGAAIAQTDGESDGAATVAGLSGAVKGSAAAAAGVASSDVDGAAIAQAEGDSDGAGAVSGQGEDAAGGGSTGSSAGSAAVSGSGAAIAQAEGDSDGQATVSGPSATIKAADGLSAGAATVGGQASALRGADAVSDGQASVAGIGSALAQTTGQSTGSADVLAESHQPAVEPHLILLSARRAFVIRARRRHWTHQATSRVFLDRAVDRTYTQPATARRFLIHAGS